MPKDDSDYASFALFTGVPFLMMSLLLMWVGLWGLRSYFDLFQAMSVDSYNIIKVILSITVLLFAAVSIYKGWITEGLLFIFVSISSLTTSIAMKMGYDSITNLDAVYGFAILICAAFMFIRKAKFRGFASFFIGLALILPNLFEWQYKQEFSSVLLIASSLIFLVYFASVLLENESPADMDVKKANDDGHGRVSDHYEIVMTIGFLLLGMLLLFDSITEYNGIELWHTSIPVSITLLSVITLIIGTYASIKGELAEALVLIIISILYMLSMIIIFFGRDTVPVEVEFVASMILFTTIISFIARRTWVLAAISILAFVQGVILSPIFGGDTSIAGTMSMIEGILCIYIAVSVWCVVELKREILPIFDRLTWRDKGGQ